MENFDTIIRGGTVVDGTGQPRFKADIGLRDGRVAEIGRLHNATAGQILDAEGKIVAPGFIDVHTHLDGQIFWDPYCTTAGWHGVTSVVLGNCGFGFAPCAPELRDRTMLMMTRNEQIPFNSMKEGMPWDWTTFPEYMDSVDRTPKGVNCIAYMPVSPLMVHVMGLDEAKSGRPPTQGETVEMQRLLDEAYREGACGWSAQRAGEKSLQADYDGSPFPSDVMGDELCLAFGEVSSRYDVGAIQISPLENPGDYEDFSDLFKHLKVGQDFSEKLAQVSGRPILHNLITPVPGHPQILKDCLKWLADCNARGNRVIGQGATLRASMTFSLELCQMFDCSDIWRPVFQGSKEEQLQRLKDPVLRANMAADHVKAAIVLSACGGFENLTIDTVGPFTKFSSYVGRKLGEVAKERGQSAAAAALDLSLETEFEIEFDTGFLVSDSAGVTELMKSSYIVPGPSDGGAHTKMTAGGGFGTDVIEWLVREEQTLTLEEAHHHLSFLPAQIAGFKDRGFLRTGTPADIIIYDFAKLKTVPGQGQYEKLHDFPANEWRRVNRATGIDYTLVNGVVTFKDGECTGATPGRLLRQGRN
jgi:N-acyl-D-amino-acid deacylase